MSASTGSLRLRVSKAPYQPGEESVIFLVGSDERFGRLAGPHLAFRVQNGRVQNPTGFAGLPESMTLPEFSAALKRLSH